MKGTFGSVLTIVASLVIALVALAVIWIMLSNLFGFSTGVILQGASKFICKSVLGGLFCG